MAEVPPPPTTASWQKSSMSADGDYDCVQVIRSQGHVWVRDSKNPQGPVLGFTREAWAEFLVGVRRDELDRSGVPS